MEPFAIIIFMVIAGISIRLMAGSFDGERVERYVRQQGWELIDRSWAPFGPGWFGEKDSKIYQIVYRDQQGRLHRAHVKTSMLSGVYLTNDRIVEETVSPAPKENVSDLKAENEQLRRRVEELEKKSNE